MTVREKGVTDDELPTAIWSPDGDEAKFRTVVCGWRSTDVVAVAPAESVAVSRSVRYEGYSWSGAENDPLATPVQLWMVWVWHPPDGQCCRISVHESRDGGTVTSSGSVALPENEIVSPTFQVREDWGVAMT